MILSNTPSLVNAGTTKPYLKRGATTVVALREEKTLSRPALREIQNDVGNLLVFLLIGVTRPLNENQFVLRGGRHVIIYVAQEF